MCLTALLFTVPCQTEKVKYIRRKEKRYERLQEELGKNRTGKKTKKTNLFLFFLFIYLKNECPVQSPIKKKRP